jgi:hypothetical protein
MIHLRENRITEFQIQILCVFSVKICRKKTLIEVITNVLVWLVLL